MEHRLASGQEKEEFDRIGEAVFDQIPMEEKLRHEGERVVICLKMREVRYYPADISVENLPVVAGAWTSIVRLERVPASTH